MELLDQCICWLTLVGAGLGGWSIYWTRTAVRPTRVRCGQGLFLATCLGLGVTLVLAASWRANGLAGLGLCLGLLVVGMLWEGPPGRPLTGPAALNDHG